MKKLNRAGWAAAALLALAALFPPQVLAQVPARFYWKNLSGGNAVPVIFNSLSGNANPFDPANTVVPNAEFDATRELMGDDFWSYGLNDANRKTLDAMARYSYEQGLAVRLLTVEEMFAESTIGGETRV